MRRRNPDHAKHWEFSRAGSAAGSCRSIQSIWVENCASLAFSGPISRCHVVLKLCGMDFSIIVQTEHTVHGNDQVLGACCFESHQAAVPASCQNELAATSDGVRRAVRMASTSASECGSSELTRLPISFPRVEAQLHWCSTQLPIPLRILEVSLHTLGRVGTQQLIEQPALCCFWSNTAMQDVRHTPERWQ